MSARATVTIHYEGKPSQSITFDLLHLHQHRAADKHDGFFLSIEGVVREMDSLALQCPVCETETPSDP